MNQFLLNGVVADNDDALKKARLKYRNLTAPREVKPVEKGKFDFEKVKQVYNSSLLDSEL
jgi:hypothetical protein